MVEIIRDDNTDKDFSERGKPYYHKDHNFKTDITREGMMIFVCEDCDCHIFLGVLKGFNK